MIRMLSGLAAWMNPWRLLRRKRPSCTAFVAGPWRTYAYGESGAVRADCEGCRKWDAACVEQCRVMAEQGAIDLEMTKEVGALRAENERLREAMHRPETVGPPRSFVPTGDTMRQTEAQMQQSHLAANATAAAMNLAQQAAAFDPAIGSDPAFMDMLAGINAKAKGRR